MGNTGDEGMGFGDGGSLRMGDLGGESSGNGGVYREGAQRR